MTDENQDIAPERLLEMAKRGEIPIDYVDKFPTTLTKENLEKFRHGELTWGQLLGMRPDETYAICTMGHTLFEQGRFDDARILFEGLVMANPEEPYYHAMLGAVYGKKNMIEQAAAEYSVALSQDPKNINALVNRGEIYLQQGKIDQAVSDFKIAIELDPKSENPGSVRARALAAATAAIALKVMKDKGQA
jgi:tetratricopeptide (TPR) repeat protein